ncbi:MAG: DUF1565 domain-containing protein [Planctomycetes bacterium]|nr:DUF1565 domain-containing protein [Planctomycetota bacterium]
MLTQKLLRLFERALILPAFVLVIGPVQTAAAAVVGDYYVSGLGDDLYGDGSQDNPWRTISKAASRALIAGDTDITIHVGAGEYDAAAGESFPISMDEVVVLAGGAPPSRSFAVVGPGDGSATVDTNDVIWPVGGGGPGLTPFLRAFNRINSVSLSGLTIQGQGGFKGLVGGGGPSALELLQGAASITLQDNEVSGLSLLTAWDGGNAEGASVLIENNVIVDFPSTAIALSLYPSSMYSSTAVPSGAFDQEVVIRDNTFVSANERRAGYVFMGMGGAGANANQDMLVEGNLLDGCRGFDLGVTAYSGAAVTVDAVIRDNTMTRAEDGVYFNAYLWNAEMDGAVEMQGNTISLLDNDGLGYRCSASGPVDMDFNVTISGNDVTGGDYGLSLYASFTSMTSDISNDIDFVVTDNTFSSASRLGIGAGMGGFGQGELDGSFLFDGNVIRANERAGLQLGLYASGEVSNDYEVTLERNEISGNGASGDSYQQLVMGFSAFTSAACSISMEMKGNLIRNDEASAQLIELNASAFSSGVPTITIQGGGLANGFNTIDAHSPAASTSIYIGAYTTVSADIDFKGNWWGTVDPVLIEDFVYHGLDPAAGTAQLVIADLSNPLSDTLEFSARAVGGNIKLTAADGSGFVAYAGDTLIEVTVDGAPVDGVTVNEDYLSLKFPKADYSGEVTICVTNPGGQSGCTTFTVPEASSGGGGCGVMPVGGGTPTAQDFFAQYFLLLLPALFLMRRRMSGVRPQPVGYVG